MDFAQLKSNRKSSFDKLTAAAEKVSGNQSQSNGPDERFWKPTVDKAGNGSAIIRFLPAPQGEDVPFVRYWDHGFQGPGGWYIEKSLTSIGLDDPVGELNSKLWNSGNDADKETARKQKRRLHYVSNIYVVSDPGNPSNEGKVFLYEYGKKIFDKINDLMHPQFEDEDAVNPFDFWEGANFRLRIRQVEGYRNYDKSAFDSPSRLSDDDEMEQVWKTEYPLAELVDAKNFKSYEELQQKLNRVLGGAQVQSRAEEVEAEEEAWTPPSREPMVKSGVMSGVATVEKAAPTFEDDDDSLDFFKKLADE
jgi:hypothetical protein